MLSRSFPPYERRPLFAQDKVSVPVGFAHSLGVLRALFITTDVQLLAETVGQVICADPHVPGDVLPAQRFGIVRMNVCHGLADEVLGCHPKRALPAQGRSAPEPI